MKLGHRVEAKQYRTTNTVNYTQLCPKAVSITIRPSVCYEQTGAMNEMSFYVTGDKKRASCPPHLTSNSLPSTKITTTESSACSYSHPGRSSWQAHSTRHPT